MSARIFRSLFLAAAVLSTSAVASAAEPPFRGAHDDATYAPAYAANAAERGVSQAKPAKAAQAPAACDHCARSEATPTRAAHHCANAETRAAQQAPCACARS